MKKKLVASLAAAMVLGVAGTSFAAANPFVDVPAKHWAYASVMTLSQAGIVDGYGDGKFQGDKMISRYEMAQIVAKAMAKSDKADAKQKAEIEKLAAEFAEELNVIGVRVSKLEANASNVKISGNARLRVVSTKNGTANPKFGERFNLVGDAKVSDTVAFHFQDRLVDQGEAFGNYTNDKGLENLLAEAYATSKNLLPGVDVTAGRYSLNLGQTTYLAGTTGGLDGIKGVWTSGKGNLLFGYADASLMSTTLYSGSNTATYHDVANVYFAQYNYQPDAKIKFDVNMLKSETGTNKDFLNIVGVGGVWNVAENVNLVGDYWQNSGATAKVNGKTMKSYVARVAYRGANAAVPGTWGLFVEKIKMEKNTFDGNWTGAMNSMGDNKEQYGLQYDRTLAKNLTLNAIYTWDIKTTDTRVAQNADLTRVQLNFSF